MAVFSEDGSRLAVCCLDGEVKIWSSATGTLVSRFSPDLGQDETVTAACWSRVCQFPYLMYLTCGSRDVVGDTKT